MSINRTSVVEIWDSRESPHKPLLGSGRLRAPRAYYKEIFIDNVYLDNIYGIDMGLLIPRRLLAREWNGAYTENVYK